MYPFYSVPKYHSCAIPIIKIGNQLFNWKMLNSSVPYNFNRFVLIPDGDSIGITTDIIAINTKMPIHCDGPLMDICPSSPITVKPLYVGEYCNLETNYLYGQRLVGPKPISLPVSSQEPIMFINPYPYPINLEVVFKPANIVYSARIGLDRHISFIRNFDGLVASLVKGDYL